MTGMGQISRLCHMLFLYCTTLRGSGDEKVEHKSMFSISTYCNTYTILCIHLVHDVGMLFDIRICGLLPTECYHICYILSYNTALCMSVCFIMYLHRYICIILQRMSVGIINMYQCVKRIITTMVGIV